MPSLVGSEMCIRDSFDSYAKNTEPILDLKLTRMQSIERYKRCLNNEKS